VLPMQVGVGRGHEAFNPEGELLDAKQRAAVDQLCQDLVRLAAKFVDG
jgi:predicted SAM-dependent methyltransferase